MAAGEAHGGVPAGCSLHGSGACASAADIIIASACNAAHHSTPTSRQAIAASSNGVGRRISQAKPYSNANTVSNTIICPTSVSGSTRLARFHSALPITEARMPSISDTPQKPAHASGACAALPISAAGASNNASAPVTTLVSSDQSPPDRSGRRRNQRALAIEYADHDTSAPAAHSRPAMWVRWPLARSLARLLAGVVLHGVQCHQCHAHHAQHAQHAQHAGRRQTAQLHRACGARADHGDHDRQQPDDQCSRRTARPLHGAAKQQVINQIAHQAQAHQRPPFSATQAGTGLSRAWRQYQRR